MVIFHMYLCECVCKRGKTQNTTISSIWHLFFTLRQYMYKWKHRVRGSLGEQFGYCTSNPKLMNLSEHSCGSQNIPLLHLIDGFKMNWMQPTQTTASVGNSAGFDEKDVATSSNLFSMNQQSACVWMCRWHARQQVLTAKPKVKILEVCLRCLCDTGHLPTHSPPWLG